MKLELYCLHCYKVLTRNELVSKKIDVSRNYGVGSVGFFKLVDSCPHCGSTSIAYRRVRIEQEV